MRKRRFLTPTMLAAGFVPLEVHEDLPPDHESGDRETTPLLDVFRLPTCLRPSRSSLPQQP